MASTKVKPLVWKVNITDNEAKVGISSNVGISGGYLISVGESLFIFMVQKERKDPKVLTSNTWQPEL